MVDERSIEALRRAWREHGGARVTLAEFKTLVREQAPQGAVAGQDATLAAISKLLPDDLNRGRTVFAAIWRGAFVG